MNFKKTILAGIGMPLMASLLISVTSCQKTATQDGSATQTTAVEPNKQKLTIDFGRTTLNSPNAVQQNVSGVTGSANGSFITPVYSLQSFSSEAPFLSVYAAVEGTNLSKANFDWFVSASYDGNTWSAWQPMNFFVDGDWTSTRTTYSPSEIDANATQVRFKVQFNNNEASLQNAEIFVYNPGKTGAAEMAALVAHSNQITAELNGTLPANPALCAKPGFTTRATWGARAAKSAPSYTTVSFLIVHHEFASNTSSDWAARVRGVQSFHMDSNGWADIGYNYLVDPNGVTYEGRGGGENVIGAHNCAKNASTMGVCMLGNFTSVKPTNNAEYSLKRIMAWKAKQRGIDVTSTGVLSGTTIGRLTGHRASCSTECPGNSLWDDLPRLRTDVKTNFIAQCN